MSDRARAMRGASVPAVLAGDPWSGDAAGTLAAELEAGEPVEAVPVVPPGCMAGIRDEWRVSPQLRSLIRAAGKLDEAATMKSRPVRALWEMAQSREWKADGRGLLNDFPELAELFAAPSGG